MRVLSVLCVYLAYFFAWSCFEGFGSSHGRQGDFLPSFTAFKFENTERAEAEAH